MTEAALSGGFRLSKKPVIASQSEDWRGNPFVEVERKDVRHA